jgi:hypothetical protein
MEEPKDDQPKGTADARSYAYTIGGVPFLIVFFVVLFGVLTGGLDSVNVMLPF